MKVARLSVKQAVKYLNPHEWKGLPADQIFELHNQRIMEMGERYNPNDDERQAILSTLGNLSKEKSPLEYVYALDNFKERIMTDTPSKLRGLPAKKANIFVSDKGETPFERRRVENYVRTCAYEMPLLAKLRKPYVPPTDAESPLKLKYYTDFSNKTDAACNRKVELTVALADLNLTEAQQHKFKVLLGNKMNLVTNVLRIKSSAHLEAPQNARDVVTKFQRLLAEVTDATKDTFADVPLDRRHMRDEIRKSKARFPEEWKRPMDAPVKRHDIVRRLVEEVKAQKDKQYLEQYLP